MKSNRILILLIAALLVLIFTALRNPGGRGMAAVDADPAGSPGRALVDAEDITGPVVGEASIPSSSIAVRDLPVEPDDPILDREINPRHNPLQFEPDMGRRGTWDRAGVPIDPLIALSQNGGTTPGLDFSFDGTSNPTGCGGGTPPDTVGDVGPNHYVQMVNCTKVAIYDKSGNLLKAPFNLGSLWPSTTCTGNWGDPVVLYDPLADRWLLTQFNSGDRICAAVSKTPDPQGDYWLYNWDVGSFPDYFKFGVWPDAYYMSANEASYTAYAFDRASMLAGSPATFQKFTGGDNLYLPADLDGPTPPPANAPNPFYTFKDNSFHGGSDRIEIREFHVDWNTPQNTTFTLTDSINVTPFTYTVCGFFDFTCARQADTPQRLDVISEWPMHRFPYRNFSSHQALVGAFTVGGGTGDVGGAVRWFELRSTGGGWTLHQEGTQDPGDGHDRYVPSIAMDQDGGIAIAYTVSSSSLHPSIYYATRLAGDPLGTMSAEAILVAPNGSQTGSDRWGDYAAMGVDPANDCSFWFTSEYYSSNSSTSWKTRVGVFTVPTCGSGGPTPTPSHTATATATPTMTPSPTATIPGPTMTPTATPDFRFFDFLPLILKQP